MGRIDNLTILSLLIHEHRISLHLFRSFLTFFVRVFYFYAYRSYIYLDRFIPKYFKVFDANVNGTVLIISNSSVHCWYEGKQLILYIYLVSCDLAVVIYSFQVGFLFCQFFGILYIDNHVTLKQRQFYFFLSNLYTFYFFKYLALLSP